jgi:hypothetical protein
MPVPIPLRGHLAAELFDHGDTAVDFVHDPALQLAFMEFFPAALRDMDLKVLLAHARHDDEGIEIISNPVEPHGAREDDDLPMRAKVGFSLGRRFRPCPLVGALAFRADEPIHDRLFQWLQGFPSPRFFFT